MNRVSGKMALVAAIIGFGVFLGVDAASKGVERVQGAGPETASRTAQAAGGAAAGSGTALSAGAKGQAGAAANAATPAGAAAQGKLGPASRPGQPGVTSQAVQSARQTAAAAAAGQTVQQTQSGQIAGTGGQSRAAGQFVPPADAIRESFINRLSNKIGEALRLGAKLLLKCVVSLFDALAG